MFKVLSRLLVQRDRRAASPAAEIDGISFFADGASAGAAFFISDEAGQDAIEVLDGSTIEIRKGSRIIVARGTGPDSYELARDEGLDSANKGLDLLCTRGSGDYSIREAAEQHIAWWTEKSRSVVRVLSTPTIRITIPQVTLIGGTPVVPPPPQWQESLRYFRLAQITDDLFDAYRNLYLALESILDAIAPQKLRASGAPDEKEGAWFKRAVGQASTLVDLTPFASAGASDPVQALWDELYRDRRSALFHAKSSRVYLLPHSSESRSEVAESLKRIARLYLALAEKVTHVRRMSSGVTPHFWKLSTDHLPGRLAIVATDDTAPFSADDKEVNPSGGRVVPLKTAAAPEYDRPFERAFLGHVGGRQLRELAAITRLCSVVDGEPHTAHVPEGVLRVPLIDRFEVLLTLRAQNVSQPKALYAS